MIFITRDSYYMSGMSRLISTLTILMMIFMICSCLGIIDSNMFSDDSFLFLRIVITINTISYIASHVLLRYGYRIGAISMFWTGILLSLPFLKVDDEMCLSLMAGTFIINLIIVVSTVANGYGSFYYTPVNFRHSRLSQVVCAICTILTLITVAMVLIK